jgi:hypothetical protein
LGTASNKLVSKTGNMAEEAERSADCPASRAENGATYHIYTDTEKPDMPHRPVEGGYILSIAITRVSVYALPSVHALTEIGLAVHVPYAFGMICNSSTHEARCSDGA